jgi:hypothetical protein
MLRIPHCLDNRLTDGGEVVSLTHRPRSTPHKHFSASGTHESSIQMRNRKTRSSWKNVSLFSLDTTKECTENGVSNHSSLQWVRVTESPPSKDRSIQTDALTLVSHDTDCTENDAFKNSYIVACIGCHENVLAVA